MPSDKGMGQWHRCKRWEERGLTCPFDRVEEKEKSDRDEDVQARGDSAAALQRAIGEKGLAGQLQGMGEFLGPLLALYTILRAVQSAGPAGTQLGRVFLAGLAEEATVRVLRPEVPAREGPTPARPTPSKAPVGSGRAPPPKGGGGGGGKFFDAQAKLMGKLIK